MASVWVARQRGKHGFEKLVAIKTILPKFAADMRFQEMFLDEARIASRIEHVNVARILDLGEEHDVLYLAMEYVDGDALSKLHRACQKQNATPPAGVILRILADACSGLHEAHELRGDDGKPLEIVHRDVSPHNILVSTKGIAKLIDFGIAKARDRASASETNSGVLKGKIQYMAPEQALGRPVDRRADVWAVGAVLYHLLTGKPPYEADNKLGTLHLLTSGRPPLPLPPSIHPSVANIARKALTTAPERRYSTAAEMRDAIEAAMLDAKIPTTAADVAAYALEQLSDRTAKRRQIDRHRARRGRRARARRGDAQAEHRADGLGRHVGAEHPHRGGRAGSAARGAAAEHASLGATDGHRALDAAGAVPVRGALAVGGAAGAAIARAARRELPRRGRPRRRSRRVRDDAIARGPRASRVGRRGRRRAAPRDGARGVDGGGRDGRSGDARERVGGGRHPDLLGGLPAEGRRREPGGRARAPSHRRPSRAARATGTRRDDGGDGPPASHPVRGRRVLAHIPCGTSIDGGRSALARAMSDEEKRKINPNATIAD